MSDVTFGQLIDGNPGKDAIHIACVPVVAEMDLKPGWHVGLYKRTGKFGVCNQEGRKHTDTVGIVDPFLTEFVKEGQKFWLFLYPQTVTGIRHEWTHPLFPSEKTEDSQEVAACKRRVHEIATSNDMTYDKLLHYAGLYLATGKVSDHMNASEDLQDSNGRDCVDEFWKCYKVITGTEGSGQFLVCCY